MISRRFRNLLLPVVIEVPWLSRALKHSRELDHWKTRHQAEGLLGNAHYEYFYTTHFDIDREFYRGKRILDIGCGPRGSLEWADMATERVGLDPLVPAYGKLGIKRHKMSYCTAGSEQIPFPDGYFDVVSSINSLDHVDDVKRTLQEITRVVKPGGILLIIVEVNHGARICEPHNISIGFVDDLLASFTVTNSGLFGGADGTKAIRSRLAYPGGGPGWLSAILTRQP